MNHYKIKCHRGVDDLLVEHAFSGNSQGDESWSNEIEDYKEAKGWLGYNFGDVDINDQEAIYAEVQRRKKANLDYIDKLKKEGKYKEVYYITLSLVHNPIFDDPKPKVGFPLSSHKMVFLTPNNNKMEQTISTETQALINEVDSFANLMKERLIQKANEGYTGWQHQYTTQELIESITERLPRMIDLNDPVEIGIANWALIAHILKNKKLNNGK